MLAPSNVDENMELYERVRLGDTTAIDEMIERNMPLAYDRVNAFVKGYRRFRHLKDDLQGEALLALTKVVQSFVENDAKKPTGKIVFEIDRRLGHYIDEELGAGMMSDRSIRRKRGKGDVPHRLPIDVNNPPRSLWQHADGRVIRKVITEEGNTGPTDLIGEGTPQNNGPSDVINRKDQISRGDARQIVSTHIQPDETPETDLLDMILACCGCEEEEMIVHLRIKEYSDEEIGEQLGLSRSTVNLRRQQIEERFHKLREQIE